MWRSPLPNRIQPSAMRWRVGRRPTSRSMDFTSRQGQPVSAERGDALAARSAPSTALVKTMVRDGVMGTTEPFKSYPARIVAFVTYGAEHATPSQQHWGDSELDYIRQGVAGFAPRAAYVRSSRFGHLQAATDRTRMANRRNSFGYDDLLACARGELFGAGNAQLPLPPMLMFDRISEIAEAGGEYGKGLVRAVLELKPDLWFFPCHFKGDPVMPGCLGLDALWQLLGFFLGWLGAPGKGRALGLGELKFSGQVLPTVKNVVYGIDIKRVMRSKLVLGIADGWLSADGSIIYRAIDLKVGLFRDEVMQPSGG